MEKEKIPMNIEKSIQYYDNMKEAYGTVSEEAGDEMAEIGLIAKAIQYYNASNRGYSQECKNLENLAFKDKMGMKDDFREIFYSIYSNPEVDKRNIELNKGELHLPESVPYYELTLELEKGVTRKN